MSETAISDEQRDRLARESAQRLQQEDLSADANTLRLLFTEARTHYGWQDKPVGEDLLRELYDLVKMGPTSMNQQPGRYLFVISDEAKQRLKPCLMEANVPKVMSAPVTVIIGYDLEFWRKLPQTFPPNPNAQDNFKNNQELARANAVRNGTLQGGYLILAARALGLDVGPMSGFNNAKVDQEFFADTTIKSNFLCNLGYADTGKIFRRLPRLDFDDVCRLL